MTPGVPHPKPGNPSPAPHPEIRPMYATLSDIERAYPGLAATLAPATDPDDPTGVDAARVERALVATTEEIDAALRARYAVPLVPVPALVTRLTVEIALALLPDSGAEDNNLIQTRAKAARAALADLRDGKTSLGLSAAVASQPTSAGDEAIVIARAPMFGDGALRAF